MMYLRTSIFLFLVLFLSLDLVAQGQKFKIYRTWISLNNKPLKTMGVLYEIQDSSILVSNSAIREDYLTDRFKVTNLYISEIETIQTRRIGNIGSGFLLGAVTGLAVGVIMGLSSGDDPPCQSILCFTYTAEEKALMAGTGLAILGGGIGALIGSIKVKIPINGRMESFNKNKNKLRGYSIRK